jgi:hypothetical protein
LEKCHLNEGNIVSMISGNINDKCFEILNFCEKNYIKTDSLVSFKKYIFKEYNIDNFIMKCKKDWNIYDEKNIISESGPVSYYIIGDKKYNLNDNDIVDIILKKQLNKIYDSGYIMCQI